MARTGAAANAEAELLGLLGSLESDELKDAGVSVNDERLKKKPKLTHELFFENPLGLKAVVKNFPKIPFRGKGKEFEDLRLLLQQYDRWFKDLYPSGGAQHLEDLASKSRKVLEEVTKTDGGEISDPREQLHRFRFEYKQEGGAGSLAARELAKEAAAAKAALRSGGPIPESTRQRIEENKRRALERRQRLEEEAAACASGSPSVAGVSTSTAPTSAADEARLRIEANRKRAQEIKRQREEADMAAALEADEAAFAEAAAKSSSGSAAAAVRRPAVGFDEEDDPFGLGFGMDSDSFEPLPPKQPSQARPAATFLDEEEEDPFGLGFGLDDDAAALPTPAKLVTATAAAKSAPTKRPTVSLDDDEDDPFGFGFDMEEM